jgi:hypothetical protein
MATTKRRSTRPSVRIGTSDYKDEHPDADYRYEPPATLRGVKATTAISDDCQLKVTITESPDSPVRVDCSLTIDDAGGMNNGEVIWINRFPEDLFALAETIQRAWHAAEDRGLLQGLDSVELSRLRSGAAIRVRSTRATRVTQDAPNAKHPTEADRG